ncbi:MAG: hypothetical protein R3A80_01340 [Bdellovibrionota bacterium]
MRRLLCAALLTCFIPLNLHAQADDIEVDDPVYLDGYVGLGGAFLQQLSAEEEGTRQIIRVEFARIRKWISLDARVGLGQNYSDFGGLFRVYKHWKFNKESSTGISFGAGVGAMYSQGATPVSGLDRQPFIDAIGAPFIRYIWDWGNGMGLGIDLEYQLVPLRMFTEDTDTDNVEDDQNLRQRIMLGVSLLFEVG